MPVSSPHFTIGGYKTLESDLLSLHVLGGEENAYSNLLSNAEKCITYLSENYGAHDRDARLNIIEIPDTYESFAGDGFIYQESRSLTDERLLQHIYHELVHTNWNPLAQGKVQRTRFFDEANAQHLSARVIRHLEGVDRYVALLDGWLNQLKKRMENDEDASTTPISEYWRKEIGALSIKGPIFLHLIERLVGTDAFDSLLYGYMRAHRTTISATFENFQSELEVACGTATRRCFSEWIYGAESSPLVGRAGSVTDLESEYA